MSLAKHALIAESLPLFLANYTNPHTQKAYEHAIQHFLHWYTKRYGHALEWTEWVIQDTTAWHKELTEQQTATTARAYLTRLKQFTAWALDEGYLTADPARKVKGIKLAIHQPEPLTRPQQNALLRALATDNPFHRIMIVLLLHTGLRASELTNLRLQHITLGETHRKLSEGVPRQQIRTGTLEVVGKGYKQRFIPLNSTACGVLIEWMALRPATTDDHLFISPMTHGPISPKALNSLCEKYRHIVPHLHPHTFRAAFATALHRAGVPLEVIQQLLGHSNIQTTQRYYVAVELRQEYVEWIADE